MSDTHARLNHAYGQQAKPHRTDHLGGPDGADRKRVSHRPGQTALSPMSIAVALICYHAA